jgi:hypothetical protein
MRKGENWQSAWPKNWDKLQQCDIGAINRFSPSLIARHAELVSASILPPGPLLQEARWTLNQVQGDDGGHGRTRLDPPFLHASFMIHPVRWTSTPPPIRPSPQPVLHAATGRPPGSGSSSPPCSNMAASAAPRGWRACPAPARTGCARACPAANSTASGPMRWRCTPRGWPIPSRRQPPAAPQRATPGENRRVPVASLSRRWRATVASGARRDSLTMASPWLLPQIAFKKPDDAMNFACRALPRRSAPFPSPPSIPIELSHDRHARSRNRDHQPHQSL